MTIVHLAYNAIKERARESERERERFNIYIVTMYESQHGITKLMLP